MSDQIPVQPESAVFWEGAKNHEVRLQYCPSCNTYQFYPRLLCRNCKSELLNWKTISGRGVLLSYSKVFCHPSPNIPTPFILGLIRLHEGVTMLGKIDASTDQDIRIGREVEAVYESENDKTLINFRVLE